MAPACKSLKHWIGYLSLTLISFSSPAVFGTGMVQAQDVDVNVNTGNGNPASMYSQANYQVRNQMRTVANFLQDFCQMNYRFPNPGDERDWAQAKLTMKCPENPFKPDSTDYAQDDMLFAGMDHFASTGMQGSVDLQTAEQIAQAKDKIHFADDSFGPDQIQEYAKNPPPNWVANPGTITAVSNDNNMFVVWGAGYDGKPIRDPMTGRVFMIQGMWSQ